MTFNIGTPVSITVDGTRVFGTVSSVTRFTVFVRLDDGRKGFGRKPESVSYRTMKLNGTDAFFDIDGNGDMTLWEGTPESDYPMPIARECDVHSALWLYLWAQSD